MSLIRKIFSDSAFTAVRSVTSLIRGIVVIPLITNLLGTDAYGIWVTIISVITLISSSGGMHLHGSLIRFTAKENTENQTYSDVLCISIIVGIVIMPLAYLLWSTFDLTALFGSSIVAQVELFTTLILIVFLSIIYKININYPRSKQSVVQYDLLRIARNLLQTGALIVVFWKGGGIISGMVAIVGVLAIMNVGIMGYIFLTEPIPSPSIHNFPSYISYGAPMIPKEFSRSLLANSDKYLLLYFLNPAAVGIYSVAQKICMPIVELTNIFNPTLYPTIAHAWDEGNKGEVEKVYGAIFRYYSLIGIPAMVGIILLSESLLQLLSTIEVAKSGLPLVPIFIFGYFVKGYDNSLRYILTSAERTDIIGLSVIVSVVINIVCNVVLIPIYGMMGAAFATLLAHVFLFLVIVYFVLKHISIEIPWMSIFRAVVSSAIMAVVLIQIPWEPQLFIKISFYPILGASIYFGLILCLGELSLEEVT